MTTRQSLLAAVVLAPALVFAQSPNTGASTTTPNTPPPAGTMRGTPSTPDTARGGTMADPHSAHGAGTMGATGTAGQTGDSALLAKLHHVNQMEIDLGKLAQENGQSKQVKQYGQKLVKDHTKASKDLETYATKNNLQLQTLAMDPSVDMEKQKHNQSVEQLRGLKGAEFDAQFLSMMVQGHQDAVSTVQTAAETQQNPELKKMLNKLLPQLKQHRQEAEKLQASVGAKPAGSR
jgi:putative membrane protein